MGFWDLFSPQRNAPAVQTILPDAARQEILRGRLPVLRTSKLFLKSGETCHYIDKAIYEKKTVRKRYVRNNRGYSVPGLFKGTRVSFGGGTTDQEDNVSYQMLRGILYVTNRRVIFQGDQEGFTVPVDDLVAVNPYRNCVELQTNKAFYRIFVPDGNVTQAVLHLVK